MALFKVTALNFVIPSVAEGPAVRPSAATTVKTLHPNYQHKVRQPFKLCPPEGSRGPCSSPSAATTARTLHPNNHRPRSANHLNFVIPSVAEEPAVRPSAATTVKTLHPNYQRPRSANHLDFVILT